MATFGREKLVNIVDEKRKLLVECDGAKENRTLLTGEGVSLIPCCYKLG
jgi:hypothetical protein